MMLGEGVGGWVGDPPSCNRSVIIAGLPCKDSGVGDGVGGVWR